MGHSRFPGKPDRIITAKAFTGQIKLPAINLSEYNEKIDYVK